MPNYTMTEMSFTGDPERIKELREMIRTDDAVIDFNKIIHMPESLNMEEGTATDRGLSAILTAINPGTPDYGEKKVSIKTFTSLVKKVRKACGPFNTEDTIRVNAPETINKKNIKNGQIYLNNIKSMDIQHGMAGVTITGVPNGTLLKHANLMITRFGSRQQTV